MGSRSHIGRLGVAFAGASAALLAFAMPASAAPHASADQFANVDYGASSHQGEVFLEGGKKEPTTLIGLKMDGDDGPVVHTYCVELTVAAVNGAEMKESPWSEYPAGEGQFKSQPKKVNWILHHSFPGKDVKEVNDESGVTVTEDQAVAATQAAIWHYSNGAKIDKTKNSKPVVDLYDYLTGDANAGDVDQPNPSLTITPGELAGHAGDKIGPFTVASTANEVNVAVTGPKGVKLVDKDGNAVTHVTAGVGVFLKVPADVAPGEAVIHATATATIEKGRLFVGVGDKRTQTLIVASPEQAKLAAAAKVKWEFVPPATTTPPTTTVPPTTTSAVVAPTTTSVNKLPNTGVSVLPVMGIGALLVAAGAAALFLRRRGRNA